MPIKLNLLLAAAGIALLSACSNIDLDAAKELGASGSAAAKAVYEEASAAEASFSRDPERIVLRTAIIQHGKESLQLPDFAKTDELIDLVDARTQAIGKLVPVYKSFADLAQYEAAAETEKAVGNLVTSVNKASAAAAVLTGTPFPLLTAPLGEIAKIGGGLLVEEAQKKKVEAASTKIRESLERLATLLRAEQQYAVSLRKENLRTAALLSELLMRKGLASYEDTVKGVLADIGVKPVKEIDAAMSKDPSLKAGFKALLEYRGNRALKDIPQAYEAVIELLDKTVEEHKKLEEGRPLDLATIELWVSRFVTYYERVRKAQATTN